MSAASGTVTAASLLTDARALAALGRLDEAGAMLEHGAAAAMDSETRADCLQELGVLQRSQGRHDAALASFEQAQALLPHRPALDIDRAGECEHLQRNDEALALLETVLAREPDNLDAHYRYNSLLYRLKRDDEFCASYDRAGGTPAHLLSKATLLFRIGRFQDAHDIFAGLAARDPDNGDVLASLGVALSNLDRHDEAKTVLERAVALAPDNPNYLAHLTGALLRLGDAQQAASTAWRAIRIQPLGQNHIAMLGTAWRLMDDPRDEHLMGYHHLIRTFELEPPPGFRDMADFNAELSEYLNGLHPRGREYFDQSLRHGTQTQGHIFGRGHRLVDLLRDRIVEAVRRYVRELRPDPVHPFLRRRGAGFSFSGSWSSRLIDCGYHSNHVHPGGWISSCYYVAVPPAAADTRQQQGWIQFGQSSLLTGMAPRRTVQPISGRLVLFPSYMWHGTIPFRDRTARTTIAFDVLPT